MKISDYKLSAYLEQNPNAESIPLSEVQEDEAPMENQITIEEAMAKINGLEETIKGLSDVIESLQKTDDKKENTSDDMLQALAEEVKTLKESAQHEAQAGAVMTPEQDTADDVIRKFIRGGN